ncbi:hypothetical protein [Gemmata massiliana]|uniref:hypothetical protein n=1 Tax=Gemmata massiliana TaxID=1210884 RepID=UPI0013A6E095|nr:hypothetical protein [Gemmata massiliana]
MIPPPEARPRVAALGFSFTGPTYPRFSAPLVGADHRSAHRGQLVARAPSSGTGAPTTRASGLAPVVGTGARVRPDAARARPPRHRRAGVSVALRHPRAGRGSGTGTGPGSCW